MGSSAAASASIPAALLSEKSAKRFSRSRSEACDVSPDGLRSFSEDLKNVADELTAPPGLGDTTH